MDDDTDDETCLSSYVELISETRNVMDQENLICLNVKDWVLYLRNDFDCVVKGEPYQAISFLFHLPTGQFLARVWNKTIRAGFIKGADTMRRRLTSTFQDIFPCLGVEASKEANHHTGSGMITTDFPYKRDISINCHFVVKCASNEDALVCPPCTTTTFNNEQREEKEAKIEAMDFDNGQSDFDTDGSMVQNVDVKQGIQAIINDERASDIENSSLSKKNPGGKTFVCDICPKVHKTSHARHYHHATAHYFIPGTLYTCQHCDNQFQFPEQIVNHSEKEHPGQEVTEKCRRCEADCPIHIFMAHLRQCKMQKVTKLEKVSKHPARKKKSSFEPKLDIPCAYCARRFTSMYKRYVHQKDEHSQEEFEPLSCHECDESFISLANFRHHRAIKHGGGRFVCSVCEDKFAFSHLFEKHLKKRHPEEKIIECKGCEVIVQVETFSQHFKACKKNMTKERTRLINIQQSKGIKCRYCDELCRSYIARSAHEQRVHVGLKFQCDQCDFSTVSKATLESHMKTHQGEEAKVCCPQCGKKMCKEYLERHIRLVHERRYLSLIHI